MHARLVRPGPVGHPAPRRTVFSASIPVTSTPSAPPAPARRPNSIIFSDRPTDRPVDRRTDGRPRGAICDEAPSTPPAGPPAAGRQRRFVLSSRVEHAAAASISPSLCLSRARRRGGSSTSTLAGGSRGHGSRKRDRSPEKNCVGHVFKCAVFDIKLKKHAVTEFSSCRRQITLNKKSPEEVRAISDWGLTGGTCPLPWPSLEPPVRPSD